jgi:hypothetical protein
VRRGRLPLLKHPTEDCVRCPLFEPCQIDEYDPEEAVAYMDSMLVKRDMYADHREAMQGGGVTVKGKHAS